MTRDHLNQAGLALYGRSWQRPLSLALGCSHDHVRAMASGRRAITERVASDIRALLTESPDAKARLAAQGAAVAELLGARPCEIRSESSDV